MGSSQGYITFLKWEAQDGAVPTCLSGWYGGGSHKGTCSNNRRGAGGVSGLRDRGPGCQCWRALTDCKPVLRFALFPGIVG